VASNRIGGKLGEYFGTAAQKRWVHWPKGQVVASLVRGETGAAAVAFDSLQR